MNILFLTNLVPYPLDNGGKIKSYATIKALTELGNKVDVLCFTEDENINRDNMCEMRKICESIHTVYLRLTTSENKGYMIGIALKSLCSKLSFGVYKYKSKEMSRLLKKILSEKEYDIIYFDHLQMCVYQPLISKMVKDVKYVLDEHNCEYLIMKRHADNSVNFAKKVFLTLEYKKLRKFEIQNVKMFHLTYFVSSEDKNMICKQIDRKVNAKVVPICVLEQQKKEVTNFCKDGKLRLLFLGTLKIGRAHV